MKDGEVNKKLRRDNEEYHGYSGEAKIDCKDQRHESFEAPNNKMTKYK